MMTAVSAGSPARAVASDDGEDVPPETPQQILVNALCADVDFNDDLQSSSGHDIRALVSRPTHDALPTTPLGETILGLKVEVERLVDELFLVRSRAELFASAHVATVAGHAEERAGLVLQATQKGALLALAKRDIKSLTDDLGAGARHQVRRMRPRFPPPQPVCAETPRTTQGVSQLVQLGFRRRLRRRRPLVRPRLGVPPSPRVSGLPRDPVWLL